MGEELPYCEFPGIYLFIYLSIYNIFRQGNLNQERPIFQQGPVLHMILPWKIGVNLKFERSNKGAHRLINGSQPNHQFLGKKQQPNYC